MNKVHEMAITYFLRNLTIKQRMVLELPKSKLFVKISKFGFSKNCDFISERDESKVMLVVEAKDNAHLSTLMLLAKKYRAATAAARFSLFGISHRGGVIFCCWDCP